MIAHARRRRRPTRIVPGLLLITTRGPFDLHDAVGCVLSDQVGTFGPLSLLVGFASGERDGDGWLSVVELEPVAPFLVLPDGSIRLLYRETTLAALL